jgi:hypothetical protein
LLNDGELELLANFSAKIKHELRLVDEQSTEIFVTVEGLLYNPEDKEKPIVLPDVQLSADEFMSMNWLMNKWGVRVVLKAGGSSKEHMRVCIQTRSEPTVEYIYKHTGWAKLPNGKRGFIHSKGAITKDGNDTSVKSQLPNDLRNYDLSGKFDVKESVRATLRLLDLGPRSITWPCLSSLFVPLITTADFAIHLAGRSGTYKSELASLLQSHFGAKMDSRSLPGNCASTPGALESLAYYAKNVLMVIDDFVPTLFLDGRTNKACFITMNVMLAQNLFDGVDACLNGRFVIGGAILAKQVLEHVGWHDCITFDGFHKVLAHHQASKVLIYFVVKFAHRLLLVLILKNRCQTPSQFELADGALQLW